MELEFPEKLAFLFEPARLKIIYGGRGGGKCLALGTRVIMHDGTLKKVEDIRVGDLLMGPDNWPRTVLGTARGQDTMYKVSQTSGMTYVVNSAHILSLKKSKSAISDKRIEHGRARSPRGRYPSYPEITNINVVEASNKSERWKANFRGYRAGLLHFAKQDIFIDPWYLGLWLGDGKSSDTVIYSADQEILVECQKLADSLRLNLVIYEQPNNKSVGIKLARRNGSSYNNDLKDAFRLYDLFDNKHIPQEYISNSEEIRLQVLAGLLDSDGCIHSNGYEIAQTNKVLAYQIKYLADTLGFRTNIVEKKTICSNNGVEGIAYRLTINGDTWRIPCRLPRRQIKKEDVRKNKDFLLSQIKIENIGIGEYAGFSLNGDGLFLLEDGTVTHNTENVSIALIILALKLKLRILCLREIQNSIEESVKETIEANINKMGLASEFDIKDKSITCKRTGSRFIFSGLRYKINSIKSLSKIDIAWVEEANNVSASSWDKLMPTIRGKHESDPDGMGGPFKLGPEVWMTFNPELDDDETYKRFVLNRDVYAPEFITNEKGEQERYAYVVKMNYTDNKWFPPDLRREAALMKASNYVKYLEIWEGNTKQTLDGAVYSEEILKTIADGRRGNVPHDPSKPVITAWDLGHSDKTAIWFIQRAGMEYNIINYYENRLKKLPHYIEHLQSLPYNYSLIYQPHDADNETLAARSISSMTRKAFPNAKVIVVKRPTKKAMGINAARTIFELCNFDEKNTADGWQCLSRYAYKVDEDTGSFSKEPEHDTPWSHGADAFQTFALSLKTETDSKKKITNPNYVADAFRRNQPRGWMTSL